MDLEHVKKLFIIVTLIMGLFVSCSPEEYAKQIKEENSFEENKIMEDLEYYKDLKTNLCFVIYVNDINSYRKTMSFTCVSCDSLKNVKVKMVESD